MSTQIIESDEERLQRIRNQINYENASAFRKFLYGWKFTTRQIGIKGFFGYPITWINLWVKTRK